MAADANHSLTQVEWITFGPFVLFPGRKLLKRDGKNVPVGDKPLELLIALIERPGQIVSKAELAERVWQRKHIDDVNLRVTVANLRRHLGLTPEGDEFVVNSLGRGYFFSPDIAIEASARPCTPDQLALTPIEGALSGRLPSLLKPVFGRLHDINSINSLLEVHRLVTISGTGGIGKTTVAISAASRRNEIEDGVTFVDFAPIQDPALVPARIAAALGLERFNVDVAEFVLSQLSNKKRLLVFDNCEHVVEAVADFSEQILRRAAGSKIIATSREPLRAEGEVVFRLGSLAYPAEGAAIDVRNALEFSAIQLLVDRAQAAHSQFRLTDELAHFAAEICRRLDGIALAIQLAASRVPAFGVIGVAARLDDRFLLLTNGQRTALPRHQTLEGTVSWSYDLLTETERAIFTRLAVFCGSFSAEAATEVARCRMISKAEVMAHLATLVDKSLVVFNGSCKGPGYRLLETVRAFAYARLRETGQEKVSTTAHTGWVVGQCREFFGLVSSGQDLRASAAARDVLDDLRAALARTLEAEDRQLAYDLVLVAIPPLMHLGLCFELRGWIRRALERETEPPARLTLMLGLGAAQLLSQGDIEAQISLYREAHALAQSIGDVTRELQALQGLVITFFLAGQPRDALAAATCFHHLARSRNRGTDFLVGKVLQGRPFLTLGEIVHAQRILQHVVRHYPPSVAVADVQRYTFNQRSCALRLLALTEWLTTDAEHAARTATAAVLEAGEHIPTFFLAISESACVIAIEREEWATAQAYVDELYRRCGTNARFRDWTDALSAILAVYREPSAAALERLALTLHEEGWQTPSRNFWYLLQLAKGCIACGQTERAGVLLDKLASRIRSGKTYVWLLPEVLRHQAELLADADPAGASARFREAAELARTLGATALEASIAARYLRRMQPPLASKLVQRFLENPLQAVLGGFDTTALFADAETIDADVTTVVEMPARSFA
ncbi:ATP-binding protein [Bradyrhizobium sp. 1(2017)]|uniref:ATP-binding protein n=1 Tax=Bradyrhizobium sp. 1(2017) TaxID=1404888 RepID=UPI00140EDBCC|nr:winged helix-turn-helix domain-containing protein [Bradyrhizobium sp. 1(2017)]QIO36907.1 hypothetical protein HAP40_36430 [Bradyrhizobium sp. 1(2017)]